MAITSKNLYKVQSINQTKKLTNVVGYNTAFFDSDAFKNSNLDIDENDPLSKRDAVISATKKFGGDPENKDSFHSADKVSALEITRNRRSIFEIIANFSGIETQDDADIRVVRGEFYENASKSEEEDIKYGTISTKPPIKMTIGPYKNIEFNDAKSLDRDNLSTVDWRLGLFALSAALVINPALIILIPTYSYLKTIWEGLVAENSAEEISRFPIYMEPDDSSLGNSNSTTALPYSQGDFAPGQFHAGNRFFLVYRPFNLDIASLVGKTKIVIPTKGPDAGKNPFSNFTKDDVNVTLNNFFSQVLKLAKTTSHAQMQGACQLYLKDSAVRKGEAELAKLITDLAERRKDELTGAPANILEENITLAKDALKRFWASTVIVERFLNQLNDQIKNIYDPSSIESNIEKNNSMGIFFNKYKTYFEAYYSQIPPSKSRKNKSTEKKLKNQKDVAVANSTTNVTANLAQQERDFNRLQAESQIIRISGTGVNKFSHPDFANTMSILDILRDEQPHPSFEKSIAVEETSGVQTTSTSDSATACSSALKSIPKTTRALMKKALEAKKAEYLKKMFKELFSLKRLQNDPSFKAVGFFSGFGGISFAQFSSLSFDVGDFDAAKFSAAFNFSGLRSQVDAVLGVIKDLSPLNMANKYLAQLNVAAGIFSIADASISAYLSQFGGVANLKKYIQNISPEYLSKCPTLSQAKATIENDENSTNEILDKQQDGLNAVMNNFNACISSIENLNSKIGSIQSQTELLDLDVDNTNQIISGIPSSKQKASRFDLGTNLTDDLVNLNVNIPYVQTQPTLEM